MITAVESPMPALPITFNSLISDKLPAKTVKKAITRTKANTTEATVKAKAVIAAVQIINVGNISYSTVDRNILNIRTYIYIYIYIYTYIYIYRYIPLDS